MWESNPPFQLLAGNTGFEGRAGHQNPMRSRLWYTLILPYFSGDIKSGMIAWQKNSLLFLFPAAVLRDCCFGIKIQGGSKQYAHTVKSADGCPGYCITNAFFRIRICFLFPLYCLLIPTPSPHQFLNHRQDEQCNRRIPVCWTPNPDPHNCIRLPWSVYHRRCSYPVSKYQNDPTDSRSISSLLIPSNP